jgi:hypothetical protein
MLNLYYTLHKSLVGLIQIYETETEIELEA